MKILIADDDPVSLRILERNLLKWGYTIQIARDGLDAWTKICEEDSPRLAVLDWMMPGMDGVDLCRKIRENKSDEYIYIILLTAKTQKEDIIAGLDAGADDYITKPFNQHELEVRLRAGKELLNYIPICCKPVSLCESSLCMMLSQVFTIAVRLWAALKQKPHGLKEKNNHLL